MADRRYNTQAWQRLRLQVLARDGYSCQIQGPRCHGGANTVPHILPSSTHPERFWDPSNLQAACGACNYASGAHLTAANRRAARERVVELEQENARLERIVEMAGDEARGAPPGARQYEGRPHTRTGPKAGATGDPVEQSPVLAPSETKLAFRGRFF
jgi:hypothetical protein